MAWNGVAARQRIAHNKASQPWESHRLNRPICLGIGLLAFGVGLVGCDYSPPPSLNTQGGSPGRFAPPLSGPVASGGSAQSTAVLRKQDERAAILESAVTLIQRAALQPGGENFKLATEKLNYYFEGTSLPEYQLAPQSREYLRSQLPPNYLKDLESRAWSLRDARHLEDCMMYYKIATRVAGNGDDLDRVRRVFDWVVRQIQLVPPGSLGSPRLPQAFARPYDILLRGMATEADGSWAERSWLFMALCRQLDIDTGLITYTKSSTLEPRLNLDSAGSEPEFEGRLMGMRRMPKVPVVWICAALVGDKAYLFDARLGLEVPGPDGKGVATIDQALADPAILERMNLPGLSPYGTSRASLLASPTKLGILIDSSRGYFSPKMRMLQSQLAGKDRTILYCDGSDQRDHFAAAFGSRLGRVSLWSLPLEVDRGLFTDARFVESIQSSLFLFRGEFPLLYARVKQLRGEFDEAIEDYVRLRFAEKAPLVNNKRGVIPQEIQDGLDIYATYYLALAHLERNNVEQAELMLRKLLEILPEAGPNLPFYNMFRWGANANLGRIYEAKKDLARAIAYDTQNDPTSQYVGNVLRARELVWQDPIARTAVTLPPPPTTKPTAPKLVIQPDRQAAQAPPLRAQ
jgi:tetratricopeptide (TPR) repeat protein